MPTEMSRKETAGELFWTLLFMVPGDSLSSRTRTKSRANLRPLRRQSMILDIAAVHHTFPDGSQFEGVGITPDVPVDTTPDDLRTSHDRVLQKALEIAQRP